MFFEYFGRTNIGFYTGDSVIFKILLERPTMMGAQLQSATHADQAQQQVIRGT